MSDKPSMIAKVIGYLRAGYPQGVPQSDYVALLGVLRRHLTDAEIAEVAREVSGGPQGASLETIREAIAARTVGKPDPEDVQRVASHLLLGGWPLAASLFHDIHAESLDTVETAGSAG